MKETHLFENKNQIKIKLAEIWLIMEIIKRNMTNFTEIILIIHLSLHHKDNSVMLEKYIFEFAPLEQSQMAPKMMVNLDLEVGGRGSAAPKDFIFIRGPLGYQISHQNSSTFNNFGVGSPKKVLAVIVAVPSHSGPATRLRFARQNSSPGSGAGAPSGTGAAVLAATTTPTAA